MRLFAKFKTSIGCFLMVYFGVVLVVLVVVLVVTGVKQSQLLVPD